MPATVSKRGVSTRRKPEYIPSLAELRGLAARHVYKITIFLVLPFASARAQSGQIRGWPEYGGTLAGQRYSSERQIKPANGRSHGIRSATSREDAQRTIEL